MDKQEFKDFCHIEFTKRGFVKRKNVYWLQGKDFLGGICFKKSSYGPIWVVEYRFFIGQYNDVKLYPELRDFDVINDIEVLSKDTIKGKKFMDGWIEYERYNAEELKLYFDVAFDEHIMPAIINGKEFLLKDMDYYSYLALDKREKLLKKLGVDNVNQ